MRIFFNSRGLVVRLLLSFCLFFSLLSYSVAAQNAEYGHISVGGAVKNPGTFSIARLQEMPSFLLKDLYLIKERENCSDADELLSVSSYRGVLLRDLLLEAGLKYSRKWEPGVFIRVRGIDGKEVVFSFGEIFYSSVGRSVLLAYEQDKNPLSFKHGGGRLLVGTDVRSGRTIDEVSEVIVERVDVTMHAYDDKAKKVVRPTTNHFTILDHKTGKSIQIGPDDLNALPSVHFSEAVMTGDCEGFGGIFSFDGPPLKRVLDSIGIKDISTDYARYVLVASEDGFCATFSIGELYNSRLGDNIIIALNKEGKLLDMKHGFATSVVREDCTGGRSVKRIHRIEIF